jgi:hypothetical protein
VMHCLCRQGGRGWKTVRGLRIIPPEIATR